MTLKHIRKAILLSVLFFPAVLFFSCEKFEENTIGQEVQPADDLIGINRVDTFTIFTKTLDADSVLVDELSANLVGSINDPVFGRLNCGTYAHLRLATENIKFDSANNISDLAIDSVVLSLAYSNFYGDTNTSLQFNVQRVDENFYADSIYYSSRSLAVQAPLLNEIESQSYAIQPKTPIKVGKDSTAAQLRIRLKNSFGQEFLNRSGSEDLANNNKFLAYFKGIYISSNQINSPGQGVIAYFNMTSSLSKLSIYYHHISKSDTLTFSMPINPSSARFTNFSQDYTGSPVAQQLSGAVSGDQEVYVQTGGGTKVELQIPGLSSMLDSGNVVINKAELILPIQNGSELTLKPHDRLLLQALKADGSREILVDQLELDSYFGGFYNASDKSYHFTITRYVQQILTGVKPNLGIQVISAGSGVSANRTVLSGTNNALGKPTLKLTYTKP